MNPRGRSRAVAVLLAVTGALALAGPLPARAQEGSCVARFNGVEAEQIASLSSPLLLDADDALIFSGTDDSGTLTAQVSLLLGPATLATEAASSADPAAEFAVELPLAGAAEDAVGLLRVRGTTDHCTVEAWLRVGGRSPFTTTAGLMAIGLLVAGLAGLAAALVARRRWSRWVAAIGGLLIGAGGVLLIQQAGRLQLSYWSLAACALPGAAVGIGLAIILQRQQAPPTQGPASQLEPAPERPEPAAAAAIATPAPAARSAPIADLPTTKREAAQYWCYVLDDVDVLHLDDYNRVVATLRPGDWYLVSREVSGWAQVEATPGVEGWVPRRLLHRQD